MRVVVICIDCLRYDVAHNRIVAPRISKFLDGAVDFTNAFAAGPSTIPGVATCLTGKVTGEHGVIETYYKPRVESWVELLSHGGFKTICYTANHFSYALGDLFDEWHELPWMDNPHNTKSTQDSYGDVWQRIKNEKDDAFFYVHLMDVHPPYRLTQDIRNDAFPLPIDKYDLCMAIEAAAKQGTEFMNDEQWQKLRELMEREVNMLDGRIEFPGDLVFLTADHGDIVGETYLGQRRWSHAPKHFPDEQLHIPFALKMKGERARKVKLPLCTRFLGDIILAFLDDAHPWPAADDLYWEDYWNESFAVSVRDPAHPDQVLSFSEDRGLLHNHKSAEMYAVPRGLLELLFESMARHNNHQNLYRTEATRAEGDDERIVTDRLKALGYIS